MIEQLEVGKTYKTRTGTLITIRELEPGGFYRGTYESERRGTRDAGLWHPSGLRHHRDIQPLDLVELA